MKTNLMSPIFALVASLAISSGARAQTVPAAAPNPPTHETARTYRIGVGDVIDVAVYQTPEASVSGMQVRSDGKVTMPFVKEISVRGMTTTELETTLRTRLEPFFKDPEVTVMAKQINSEIIYTFGAVKHEGAIPLKVSMTVLQALAESGGLTDYAKRKKIYILREVNGKQIRLPFNYEAVLKGLKLEQNIQVLPGDTIVVPR